MKIALAQINTTIGDFSGNEQKILAAYNRGVVLGVELVVFPELATCGYPPRDLLLRPSFVADNLLLLERLTATSRQTAILVGYVGRNETGVGRTTTNSTALLQNGKIVATRSKTLLPTYDVFDEDRYFEPSTENAVVGLNGRRVGLTICEDVWNDEDYLDSRRYHRNPPQELLDRGIEVLFNNSASPWHLGKNEVRCNLLTGIAKRGRSPVVYCNLVGGNDELIFDGGSLVIDASGEVIARGKLFAEDLIVADTNGAPERVPAVPFEEQNLFEALSLGLRDYVHKCGFKAAVIGLSGGIDSAVVACIAAHALGKENIRGVSLPSEFSSQGSLDDARELAQHLGIRYDVIPIQRMFGATKEQLAAVFAGLAEDTTEENIQARLRGVVLMALSNKFGSLLLTTGNKSELSVGYCTLYGDMCGGLAVISDVPKTSVYRLAKWINRDSEVIPVASIEKPPSAELRPNQTDQDSLPPYEVLDAILEAYVVRNEPLEQIVARGYDAELVKRIVKLVNFNEYKRRQAAPGLKVTTKAFGVGRRIPIAHRYREWL